MFSHVANPFARRTLDVGKERTAVAIRAGNLSASTGGTTGAVAAACLIAVGSAASTVMAIATAVTEAAATRSLVATNTVAGGDILDP
jgi:hypothetical protein